MTVSKANLSVDEMLQLARQVDAGFMDDPSSVRADVLARAVIELLSAPKSKYEEVDFDSPNPNCPIRCGKNVYTPAQARSLAVAILRAADDAETHERSEP